jgi:glycosyltransferase involved in cell wall biosynthesis
MATGPVKLSVVIPAFNRPEPLKYTLRSVDRAAAALGAQVEVVLVDDGSVPPVTEQLAGFGMGTPMSTQRQENQGSIAARLNGLGAARGEFVLFLDSDDLVHPGKFASQIAAMRESAADVSYADMALAEPAPGHEIARYTPADVLAAADDPATLFIEIQPAPHNPIYRRDYLLRALAPPLVPRTRSMDPSGDVWLFYNLAVRPARIVKVAGPFSAPGPHSEDRYSRHWERLGVAALLVMEAFDRACPRSADTVEARRAVGEAAFRTWRGLPRGFDRGFARRMLRIYRRAPHGDAGKLGTPSFARIARVIGPVAAGLLLRAVRARPYESVRTLPDEALGRLLGDLGRSP